MAKKTVYDESSMDVVIDDIERIRNRPNTLLGYYAWNAFFKIIIEIVQNAIDEFFCAESPCNVISIEYFKDIGKVTITDNGRGIPLGSLQDAIMYQYSSGKYHSDAYINSAGENGVGLTCANALSEDFTITSTRDGQSRTIKTAKGVIMSDVYTKAKKGESSTSVSLIPDKSVLGDFKFKSSESISNWINNIKHLVPGCKFIIKAPPEKVDIVLESKKGLLSLYEEKKDVVDHSIMKPLRLEGNVDVTDKIYVPKLKTDTANLKLDMVFTFNGKTTSEEIHSFVNFCHTVDHGTHVTAVRQAIGEYLLKIAKKNMNKADLEKLNPNINDVRTGLFLIVNILFPIPQFVGQTKEKIEATPIHSPLVKLVKQLLDEAIGSNKKLHTQLTKYIKKCAENRIKGRKAREKSMLDTIIGGGYSNLPKKFKNVSDKNGLYKNEYELFIVEGDSAGGTAKQACIDELQAVQPMRGKPINAYKHSITRLLENRECKDLHAILNCRENGKVILEKCKWKVIALLPDADSDGAHITCLLLIFLFMYYRELIEDGRVYIAIPPLYKVKYNGDIRFLTNKKDFADLAMENIVDSVESISYDGIKLSKIDISRLIYRNIEYIYQLEKISKRLLMSPEILERVVSIKLTTTNNDDFITRMGEILDKIEVDKNDNCIRLSGLYGMEFIDIYMDGIFDSMLSELKHYIQDVNFGVIDYEFNGNDIQLYNLLKKLNQNTPKIIDRFKGLGQMTADELADSVLIGTKKIERNLKKVTMDDYEETLKTVDILFGDDVTERAKLMCENRLHRDDLDN